MLHRSQDRPVRTGSNGLELLGMSGMHASISRVVAQTWCANASFKGELSIAGT